MKRLLKLTVALGLVVALFIPAGMALAIQIEVDVDIKPESCPNPLNVGSKGVLSVAILGTADFDVTQVDPASVRLVCDVAPLRWALEDVATPFDGGLYDCHELGPDGYLDLNFKFKTQEIVGALPEVYDGDVLNLTLTGTLLDGTPIVGEDVVWISKNRQWS